MPKIVPIIRLAVDAVELPSICLYGTRALSSSVDIVLVYRSPGLPQTWPRSKNSAKTWWRNETHWRTVIASLQLMTLVFKRRLCKTIFCERGLHRRRAKICSPFMRRMERFVRKTVRSRRPSVRWQQRAKLKMLKWYCSEPMLVSSTHL